MFGWLRPKTSRPASTDEATSASDPPSAPSPPPPAGPVQLYQAGRPDEAAQAARDLLAVDADDPNGLLVEALIALDGGRPLEASRILERALARSPADADLHVALGRALAAAGRKAAAQQAFERALELAPDRAEPSLRLGLMARAAGREDQALAHLTAAVQAESRHAEAQRQLADLLRARGRIDDAEQHLRRAIECQPDHAAALAELAALLKPRGRTAEAAQFLERACHAAPDAAPYAFELALLRIAQFRWRDASELLKRCAATDPKYPQVHYWLGNALMGEGDAEAARLAYQAAIRQNDKQVQARWGLMTAQLPAIAETDAEQRASAEAFQREATRLKTWFRGHPAVDGYPAVGAQQPYYIAYIPENHRAALATYGQLCTSLMGAWARKVGVPAPVRATGSKLRVGIVSAHIQSHSVWHAILRGWIEHLDASQVELQVFHTGPGRDAETEWASRRVARLQQGAGDWKAWSKTISDSRLDILIYPEIGMDSTTLRLAALRLARVQLASWGHPITTGLPTIDGYLSAQAFEPEDAPTHYTESLHALPRLGCCYRPYGAQAARVDFSAWGLSSTDRLILCAGKPFKYAPRDDDTLVELARRCRPCKLVFFRDAQGQLAARLEARLRRAFDDAGLAFDTSVCFLPWQPQAAFFGLLDRADVYLDTIGFSGFNTTMQAIERRTPVVAWEGRFMRGRFASGILRQAGLDEWVADSSPGFVDRVERLCSDRGQRDRAKAQITQCQAGLVDDRESVRDLSARLIALAESKP